MWLLYFVLWILFNGNITVEICLFGIVIATALFLFSCKFMDYSLAKEKHLFCKIGKFFHYLYRLLIEVVKANYVTVRMVLSQKEEVEPALVSFHTNLNTPIGKTLLANAITLTPGTITVSLEEDKYIVHCLDKSLAEGLKDNPFAELVRSIEADSQKER